MRKFFFIASIAALSACNNDKVASMRTGPDSANSTTTGDVTYAYPAERSKFQIGDANQAKMLTELWKDWDNGNLMAHKEYFADSFAMYAANQAPMIGPRDSVLTWAQNFRNSFTSSTSSINAIVPLNNLDSNQNWVAIWGKEVDGYKDGKKDSFFLQEVWRLNKDNKFDRIYQYVSKPPAMPAPQK